MNVRARLDRIARELAELRDRGPRVFQIVEQEDGESAVEFRARADAAIRASSERRLALIIAENDVFDRAWGSEAVRPEGLRARPNAPPFLEASAGSQPASPSGSRRK